MRSCYSLNQSSCHDMSFLNPNSSSARKMSDEALKAATARLVCDDFDGVVMFRGQRIKLRPVAIRHALESEFRCCLRSKNDLIVDAAVHALSTGVYNFQHHRFSNPDETLDNNNKEHSMLPDDGEELVHAFRGVLVSKRRHSRSSRNVSTISSNVLQTAVARLVRAAVDARVELSVRRIRQALETQFACDLSSQKDLILLTIQEALGESAGSRNMAVNTVKRFKA